MKFYLKQRKDMVDKISCFRVHNCKFWEHMPAGKIYISKRNFPRRIYNVPVNNFIYNMKHLKQSCINISQDQVLVSTKFQSASQASHHLTLMGNA